jgi:hypothetical protein
VWRYGGGDWTLPWRVYHGLGEDFRPLNDPDAAPRRIPYPTRYRHFMYGMAKAGAVLEEGAPDGMAPSRPSRRERELKAKGGIVLPTGAAKPRR